MTWIERWLPPILAERTRILDRAHAKRLERPRLGPSKDPLRRAVERNLRSKGVDADEISWDVARRKDGRWKVSARFTQRGRARTATWTYDPADDALRAASELARELGHSRTAGRGAARGAGAQKKPTKKKSTVKKSTGKQSTAKKSTGKKSTAKKSTADEGVAGKRSPTSAPSSGAEAEPPSPSR